MKKRVIKENHKICYGKFCCGSGGTEKHLDEFYFYKLRGVYSSSCKICHSDTCNISGPKRLHRDAKRRAIKKNIPFEIEVNDIVVPEYCPVFPHIKLCLENGYAANDSPSLDEIIRGRGYVKGNIIVTSYKANKMKNDGTIEECMMLGEFYSKYKL